MAAPKSMRNTLVESLYARVPFDRDLLDTDLDSHYKDFVEDRPIAWGLALGAMTNPWSEQLRLEGVGWEAIFFLPSELAIPTPHKSDPDKTSMRKVREHAALIVVPTRERDLNAARDKGRRLVRAVTSLVWREVALLKPSRIIWEGALARTRAGGLKMLMTDFQIEPTTPLTERKLRETRLRIAALDSGKAPSHLQRSLEWLNAARSAKGRAEVFMGLWLAVLALASYGQSKSAGDSARIRAYTATMAYGLGGVRSAASIQALTNRLLSAQTLRDRLFHRDDDSGLGETALQDLELAAFELVDFELAKVGISLHPLRGRLR